MLSVLLNNERMTSVKKISLLLTSLLAVSMLLLGCSTDEASEAEDKTNETKEEKSGGISEDVVVKATLNTFLDKYIAEDYEGIKRYIASVNAKEFDGDVDAYVKSLEENDAANGVDRTAYEVADFQKVDDTHFLATVNFELVSQDKEQTEEVTIYVQLEDGEWKMNFTGSIDTETGSSN